jgi:hypothetical protein
MGRAETATGAARDVGEETRTGIGVAIADGDAHADVDVVDEK